MKRSEQIKRLQKLFPNKQLVEVINGGNGCLCANDEIGIVFPKNGNIFTKEKNLEKEEFNVYWNSSRYNGEFKSSSIKDSNPLIKTYDFKKNRFQFFGLCNGYEIKEVQSESKEKRKILARLRNLQNFAKKHNIYTEEVQPKPFDHFKTSFEALVFFLNQKKVGEEVSRKEIMKFMIEGQMIATSELTVDNYRRTLTAAGYLGEVKRGVYRMLVTIPETLTTSKLNQMAYPK